jgi:hypothetical protein
MSDDPSTRPPAPQPRIGSGELAAADLATKFRKVRVRKPIYRRKWFRRTLWIGGSILLVACLGIGAVVWHWHRKQLNELARQRANVEAFVHSPEFEEFCRTIDAHTIALINYLSVRPAAARETFPQISARENEQRLLPWTAELTPMPTSAAQEPGRAAAARQRLVELLTTRGLELDSEQKEEGRRLFLRALLPHAHAFITGAPRRSFPAFQLDRSLQDVAIHAFAARGAASPAQTEQFFAVYAIVGPSFWKAVEQSRGKSPLRLPAPGEKSP